MLLWLLLALMTAAAIFAVLLPLSRPRAVVDPARETSLDVYRDQFSEIDRDRDRNLIGDAEAQSARVEVARRLLAADDRLAAGPLQYSTFRRRAAALLALLGIPAVSLGLYLLTGSPGLSGAPLSARLAALPEQQDIPLLVRRVEEHLAEAPKDGRGWEILAPIYLRMGRSADAAKARANALRLLGPTPTREADLGEALVAEADGMVTAEARAAFERANALDPKEAKARFFRGLAAKQDGRADEARSIWQALLKDAPADAPWRRVVESALSFLEQPKSGRP